jgi:hypothetical protein
MTKPATDLNNSHAPGSRRIWLFLLVYPLHVIEEIRGVGAFHGINLSLKQFFILTGAGCLLLVIGILLAQRFRFPQLLEIVLGTVFLVNGLSHIINSVAIAGYDAGLITGTLILIPLGLTSLVRLRNSMGRLRYFAAVALGLVAHGIITLLAL